MLWTVISLDSNFIIFDHVCNNFMWIVVAMLSLYIYIKICLFKSKNMYKFAKIFEVKIKQYITVPTVV